MPIKYNIEDLKKEFVGKTFNWLTVLDVYRDSNNTIVCNCRCRCGAITITPLKAIRSNRSKSCGCFHKSREFSDKLKQWFKDNPEKVKQRSSKYIAWCNSKVISLQNRVDVIASGLQAIQMLVMLTVDV